MPSREIASADLLAWLCSFTSILSVYFSAKKLLLGPFFGVLGFIPWTALAFVSGHWGLMPMNTVITVLQIRTYLLWSRDQGQR